jgi:hypothetical protein
MLASYGLSRTLTPIAIGLLLKGERRGDERGWFARLHNRLEHGFDQLRDSYAELLTTLLTRRILERHQDHAVIDADRRAVGEGQIIEADRQADIVDDQLALLRRDDLADLVLDSLEDLLGLLDARAGRGADVQLDLPGIDDREEVAPDESIHHGAEGKDCSSKDRHDGVSASLSPQGDPVPGLLSNVATLTRTSVPTNANQANIQPVYEVFANLQDRDLGSVAGEPIGPSPGCGRSSRPATRSRYWARSGA